MPTKQLDRIINFLSGGKAQFSYFTRLYLLNFELRLVSQL